VKIITYNVNGIRSAINKGLPDWIKATDADIICFQEVKANFEDVDCSVFRDLGYKVYWHAATKKGYSGVATFSRIEPVSWCSGCGIEKYDNEGRILRLDFETFSVINVYMPSGSSGEHRQNFKFQWLDDFYIFIHEVKLKVNNLVVCGDYNICHRPIDIHNPKSNTRSSGFLPKEREWMEKFFNSGFHDAFRQFNQEPHNYTWWSYRAGARKKNLGWRIDYHAITDQLLKRMKRSVILKEAMHSDHCPVLVEIL
jgi:exodeoxyribonuclease-3